MNEPIRDKDRNNTAASLKDLATGIDQCKAWLATRDSHSSIVKIFNVLFAAIDAGRSDVCQLILDSGRLDNAVAASMSTVVVAKACSSGHLSMVQLIVSRCHPSTQHLHEGLTIACENGHVEIVTWLLSEMKFSHYKPVTWLLATASARGDINTVRLLAARAGLIATEVMSQALRVACYNGRVKVVDWLITYTTADVSLCGELDCIRGSVTSLTAACYTRHVDIMATLVQCVTPHAVNIQCGRYRDSVFHSVIGKISEESWNRSIYSSCLEGNVCGVSKVLFDTNVDMIDHHGDTPLHVACRCGQMDIALLLLSVFARVDITNGARRIPVEEANRFGNAELVPYMSQLLNVTNYTPSSSAGANAIATSGVIRPTVDVIVSDVSIVTNSDVRLSLQPCAQRSATNHRQQQRQATRNSKTKFV
jgi:hypothetical protein